MHTIEPTAPRQTLAHISSAGFSVDDQMTARLHGVMSLRIQTLLCLVHGGRQNFPRCSRHIPITAWWSGGLRPMFGEGGSHTEPMALNKKLSVFLHPSLLRVFCVGAWEFLGRDANFCLAVGLKRAVVALNPTESYIRRLGRKRDGAARTLVEERLRGLSLEAKTLGGLSQNTAE